MNLEDSTSVIAKPSIENTESLKENAPPKESLDGNGSNKNQGNNDSTVEALTEQIVTTEILNKEASSKTPLKRSQRIKNRGDNDITMKTRSKQIKPAVTTETLNDEAPSTSKTSPKQTRNNKNQGDNDSTVNGRSRSTKPTVSTEILNEETPPKTSPKQTRSNKSQDVNDSTVEADPNRISPDVTTEIPNEKAPTRTSLRQRRSSRNLNAGDNTAEGGSNGSKSTPKTNQPANLLILADNELDDSVSKSSNDRPKKAGKRKRNNGKIHSTKTKKEKQQKQPPDNKDDRNRSSRNNNKLNGRPRPENAQVRKYDCPYCDYSAKRAATRNKHIERVHTAQLESEHQNASEENRFTCTLCNKSYKRKQYLNQHLRLECGKEPRYGCPFCDYRSKRAETRKRHIAKMHGNRYHPDIDRPILKKVYQYRCWLCVKSYTRKASLKRHAQAIHPGEDMCDAIAAYSPNEDEKTENPPSELDEQNSPTLPVPFESGEDPRFECPHCDYRSNVRNGIKEHIEAKHPGDEVFIVNLPPWENVDKLGINPDAVTRSIYERFGCAHCEESFKLRRHLKDHQRQSCGKVPECN